MNDPRALRRWRRWDRTGVEGRPCKYCIANWAEPTIKVLSKDWKPPVPDVQDCEMTHRDDARVYALAMAMARVMQQRNPTDAQISWFLEDADDAPERWKVRRLPMSDGDYDQGIDIRLRINDVTYVGLEGGKDSRGSVVKLSTLERVEPYTNKYNNPDSRSTEISSHTVTGDTPADAMVQMCAHADSLYDWHQVEADDTGEDLLYEAWALIANAGWDAHRGLVDLEKSPGWHEAAIRWRDRYHARLGADETEQALADWERDLLAAEAEGVSGRQDDTDEPAADESNVEGEPDGLDRASDVHDLQQHIFDRQQ